MSSSAYRRLHFHPSPPPYSLSLSPSIGASGSSTFFAVTGGVGGDITTYSIRAKSIEEASTDARAVYVDTFASCGGSSRKGISCVECLGGGGERVVSSDVGDEICFWDLAEESGGSRGFCGENTEADDNSHVRVYQRAEAVNIKRSHKLAVSNSGLIAVLAPTTVHLLKADGSTIREIREIPTTSPSTALCWSPDSKQICCGARDGAVTTYDAETGVEVNSVKRHDGTVRAVNFTCDGALVVSGGGDDGRVNFSEFKRGGELVSTYHAHAGYGIMDLDTHSDSKRVVTASTDKSMKIIDLGMATVAHTYEFDEAVLSAKFERAGGNRAVACSKGGLTICSC